MKEGEQYSEGIQQAEIDKLFSQLTAAEVGEFYQAYQLWSQRQRAVQIQQELQALREKQAQNTVHMQLLEPSAIALSAIAQLRVHEVDDIDLLDRMLDRGEDWLDNTMQLLARCEALNVIQGNYTQWCEHALEGAYEWMWSMDNADLSTYFDAGQPANTQPQEITQVTPSNEEVTEAQLLERLMSEEGEEKATPQPQARITQPLPVISPDEVMAQSEAFMPLNPGNIDEEDQQEIASADLVELQQDEGPEDTDVNALTDTQSQEQPPDPLLEELLLQDEPQEHIETEEASLPDEEPQKQGEPIEEDPPHGEETQKQPETAEEASPIEEKEPAPQGQWPYVYQQVHDKQSSPGTAASSETKQEQPATATADNSAKPHVADGKSRGLLKRSLDRFLRR